MPRARLTFAVVAAVGLLALLATATFDKRGLAFTLGVQPAEVAAVAKHGQTVCQGPIDVPADASAVAFKAGTFGKPGPPISIFARDPGGRVVGRGSVPGGYRDGEALHARLAGISEGRALTICFRNEGRGNLGLYGNGPAAARTSIATLDGADAGTDLTLVFERAHSRSMLAALPDIFERAALWHPGWVGAWTFWGLLALVAAGVPLLLWRALAAAEQVPGGSYDSRR
jgi:hypothetical protein